MQFEPRFKVLEPIIREVFEKAKAVAGPDAASVVLDLTDQHVLLRAKTRAGICVELPGGPVCITWAAIGSLWAAAQGAAQLARQMFEAKRDGKERLQVLGVDVDRYSFIVMDLHHLLLAGLPAHSAVTPIATIQGISPNLR